MRRFRLVLLAVVLSVLALYEYARIKELGKSDFEGLSNFSFKHDSTHPPDVAAGAQNLPVRPDDVNAQLLSVAAITSQGPPPSSGTAAVEALSASRTFSYASQETVTGEELLAKQPSLGDGFGEHGQARLDIKPRPTNKQRAFWQPQRQHFPVSEHQVISLPTREPTSIPKIQHTFPSESSRQKADRVKKQTAVREAFKHAWSGYKAAAWGHDELKPLTNGSADPFNGWGATLVDSLDTLWIMGLEEEFEEAVKQVSQINFKTSARKDIPMFETTIRYLGGLLGAYDISGARHTILLEKAVQLAEILLGAFDTPNRMPIPYYQWAPSYASQPHRSSTHIVMAELGSLAMEFTRLAQITKEHKYYDAIARVTNALQEWQMETSYPGVWPVKLDASGCKKPELDNVHNFGSLDASLPVAVDREDSESLDAVEPATLRMLETRQLVDAVTTGEGNITEPTKPTDEIVPEIAEDSEDDDIFNVECDPQALAAEPHAETHTYSIGAMADSTYEYFPKMFALLGGSKQYKDMYSAAMDVIRKDFLFRPMLQDAKRDVLLISKTVVYPRERMPEKQKYVIPEGTHLGCFVGAMFGLGSKMFGIPEDMAYAERLTDGCVWAYESTETGVMAEDFKVVPCDDMKRCPWNETRWHEWLDPYQKERFEAVDEYNKEQQRLQAQISEGASNTNEATPIRDPSSKGKRQVAVDVDAPASRTSSTFDDTAPPSSIFTPKVPLSHSAYVKARISEERLPPSYTSFFSKAYKLRPEALESVFVMYRLTGKTYWREKGWTMFQNIEKATRTASGHAALKDVTSVLGEREDYMESFWLAETLKYAYLLFSEEDVLDLGDWVLNTEAHPFRLPRI